MALPATQNAYVYSPMTSPTSVRFMKLLPGSGESPIDCEIFEARIEDHLPYIALSYSWGSQKDLRKISCSGTRSLEVTPNLYQALRHLRHPTELRTFWIDALCVDQKNIQERNHQVAQMKQIYSQSQKLLIWLGTSSSNLAYDLITRLAALVDNPEQPGVFQPQPWIQSQHWKALSELLTSEWFRRMWVVQELVLGLRMNEPFATEVLFGSHLVTWSELARCCGYIGRHYAQLFESSTHTADSGIIRRGVTRVDNLHGMAIRAPQDLTYSEWMVWLLKKLTTSRNKKTSDPRDKVFALYGLCCSEPQPLPDYALSPAEVYRMYAVETIRATRSLAILSQVEVRSKSSEITVPSWVPDWSVG
ncbi:heterokaryon incompatibility protein-domain-containing protein [Phaeosphaeria sp. MPI-PUGE-AT-0046c]|nr:heterokaryon incompatibility protein-domain-containing protein [Phaeosphaeria sp. MPI-PUGE-AT-0046c]